MTHITVVLAHQGFVHALEVGVHIAFLGIPFGQLADDALQVLDTVIAGGHGVVTQVFALGTGVLVVAFAAEPQGGIGIEAVNDDLVPVQVVFLGSGQVGGLVTVFDGPLVVGVDAGVDTLLGDVVFRLGHVVETGIVHDGHGVAVCLYPGLVTELLNGSEAG